MVKAGISLFLVIGLLISYIVCEFPLNALKWKDYLFVFLIGSVLSYIELASRYRSNPFAVIRTIPGIFYVAINGIMCIAFLHYIYQFDLLSFSSGDADNLLIAQGNKLEAYFYASFGSFLIMRSSLLKLGNENDNNQTDIGFNALIKKLLDMIDREVDRIQAIERSNTITNAIVNTTPQQMEHVVELCFIFVQNISYEELEKIYKGIEEAEAKEEDADYKTQLWIASEIYNLIGKSALEQVIKDAKRIEDEQPKEVDESRYEENDSFAYTEENIFNKLKEFTDKAKSRNKPNSES